jgi:hypothetical protein
MNINCSYLHLLLLQIRMSLLLGVTNFFHQCKTSFSWILLSQHAVSSGCALRIRPPDTEVAANELIILTGLSTTGDPAAWKLSEERYPSK